MNPMSKVHSLLNQSFNAVSEQQIELLDQMSTLTTCALKEMAEVNENWRSILVEIAQDMSTANYVGHVLGANQEPLDLLVSPATDPMVLSHLKVTAFSIYEMVERGLKKPPQLKELDAVIQKITLKSLSNYRKVLRRHNFDIDYLEDRVQEAAVEIIRAARCYKNTGIAAFDTYASSRVKTAISRREMHHTLMVKVSDRDISNAYSRAVEINAEKTNNKLTPDVMASSFLPKPIYDFEENSGDCFFGETERFSEYVISDNTKYKLKAFLISQLNRLNENEKIVMMNEMGLLGYQLERTEITETQGFTASRYTQIKNSALEKLGAHKKALSPSWARALA